MKDFSDYCRELYGNQDCIPGLKQKDQNQKESGEMKNLKLEYNLNELDREGAGFVVQRLAREYQEDHPDPTSATRVYGWCPENVSPYMRAGIPTNTTDAELPRRP